jgi:hypothetical protein
MIGWNTSMMAVASLISIYKQKESGPLFGLVPFIEVEHKQFDAFIFLMQFLFDGDDLIAELLVLLLEPSGRVLLLLQLQRQLLDQFLSLIIHLAVC